MKGAQAIAQLLKAEGVEHLFCFPVNHIIEAAAEYDIRPIMARTERTVVGMADAYSRVTNGRRIGVLAVQNGPGAENTFGGIAQAFADSSPILAFPGGERQERLGFLPTFDPTLNYQHVSKWAARVNQGQRIPELVGHAFAQLRSGRPGPVILEVPQDVQLGPVDEAALAYRPVRGTRSMANPADVRAALKALLAAKKPMIHAGAGVLYAEAWNELREFAELVQVPVMTTLPGKSGFPEDHPLALGSGGLSGPLMAARFLVDSDLIFGIGASLTISSFAAPVPRGKTCIQLNVDERDFNKDYPTAYPLLGDAKLVLQQFIEEAKRQLGRDGKKGDDKVVREVASIRAEWLAQWQPRLDADETPISPYRVMRDVQATLDLRNTVATHDAGNPRDQMSPFWQALEPNSYIGWGKSTHLGYGLPLALGAKVAKPEKTVVNIMGDAAFGMSGLEIETAARNKIGTLTILMNNSRLGGYDKYLPIATQKYGTRYLSGDYTKVAEGLGAYAEKVEKPDEIIPAVKRALKYTQESRPALLEIITREEPTFSKYW